MLVTENGTRRWAAVAVALACAASLALVAAGQQPAAGIRSGIQITLKESFIKEYKDRVTIDAKRFIVDKAHHMPNPPAKDGDMHVAGRDEAIGLPIVAEIMNAKLQPGFVDLIHKVEGKGQVIQVSGAWRLWCEHGGTRPQVQGETLQPFTTTNPDHVFEIHPITRINGKSLLDKSFQPIKGFATKDAHDAFVNYENIRCQITKGEDAVSLLTYMAGYNYVEFILELNGEPKELADGCAALGKVRDLEGELLVHNRRMVFVKDSKPYEEVKGLKAGKRLHVLGVPRIDLALVAWRVEHDNDPEYKNDRPTGWNLPYEMIVVAVYPSVNPND
jgi:hypothetical protein